MEKIKETATKERDKLRRSIAKLKMDLEGSVAEKKAKEREVEDVRQSMVTKEREARELQNALSTMKQEKESERSEIEKLHGNMLRKLEKLKAKLRKCKSENLLFEKVIAKQLKDISTMRRECQTLVDMIPETDATRLSTLKSLSVLRSRLVHMVKCECEEDP